MITLILQKKKKKAGKKYIPRNLLIKGYRFTESKKEDKEKSKSQAEETIAGRVKLRRQKRDDDISSLEVADCAEFIDIPDIKSLERDEEEVK